ncbi:hypothetical protein, partial [Pseudomonas sp. MPR-ANC1]|uniref:hypothetical protein n=1 Tax=Pseudomonas sp. MPR-ANC1 TaxID=2075548 RepID=UPI001C462975
KPYNSLNLKEFSVSTAPEVGRIIDLQNLPSTVNSAFYQNAGKACLYIDAPALNAQYIAQHLKQHSALI